MTPSVGDFLGYSCATDLIQSFETKVEAKLELCNVQIPMDGPNVNWAAFEKLQAKVYEDTGKRLLDVG